MMTYFSHDNKDLYGLIKNNIFLAHTQDNYFACKILFGGIIFKFYRSYKNSKALNLSLFEKLYITNCNTLYICFNII